ncbi:PREDICTED: methylmalonate-semialdehyde dehydrogenase [acylating], mitochondrial-like isoform X2 [Populus euphratica]|uniref:methylmalonate-semialdehyde dehydrogenase (CoA acylating) n=1 Tax=Populus euphratica TaxID=75702 RepID=A0AAJ6X4E4_POPEU|nr:PREDICTED: methylmalonate-semialdehyde dehydrogenase [acylating], mitochondrial-like isoform X2 [Populus euphratica]
MQTQNQTGFEGQYKMLPPESGVFQDREELIKYVRDFGANQGYVVTIKKSRRDRRVILGCDRGGMYRNRRKIDESQRKRKACSRLINCPFEAVGKKEDDMWVLNIKNGEHNHEPLKDMSEHPYSRRFSEEEVRQIRMMTEAGVKPRQVLKALKQSNPELQSTPRHLYNLKAKIRQGGLSDRSLKSWRPNRSVLVNTSASSIGESLKEDKQPVKVPNFIGGKFVVSQGCTIIDVLNPATQEVVSHLPLTTYEEFKDAVITAKRAFLSWKNTPIATRQRIMFRFQELIRRDMDKLATCITSEQGKTLKGALGDVLCGLEAVEHACAMATLQMGEFVPNASNGIDTYCIREPLGVCAGICPFNFPAMIPLWMFPIAVTCGNTFVLKPCEKNPGASMILVALAVEAGFPDGVLNVIHGTNDIVNYICDDDDVKAISFIGSDLAGLHIYARAAARGKRVQSDIGGKNHAIIMPDASIDDTLNALVAAGFGTAGQQCMALSTAVFVGGSSAWEHELVEHAKALKVNAGTDRSADLGPVISKEVKDRICRLVQSGVDSGARLLLDGRNIVVPGYENGSFVGPTILCDVTMSMDCYKEEILGPVLLCMQADNLEEAITIVNRNRYGNGASIFTTSGVAARKFQNDIDAVLVGINVSVPVPLPSSSFHEAKVSFAGKTGVQFYTQIKTVAQQWRELPSIGVSLSMHTSNEMDMTSGGVCSALPPSERDSPGKSPAPERNPRKHRELLCENLPKSGGSSVPSITDKDLHNQEASLVLPPTAEKDLQAKIPPTIPHASEIKLSSQEISLTTCQTSEGIYIPVPSQWNETPTLTSQSTESISQISQISQRIYLPPTSQRRNNAAPSLKRIDAAMDLTPECVYMATPRQNDNMGPGLLKDSSLTPTSRLTDTAAHPASERLHDIITSHLSDSMVQSFQRNDHMFPTERKYTSAAAHRNDHIGLTSQRPDVASYPSSERVYSSATSQRTDNMIPASQRAEAMPPTTKTMYMPPIVQRNNGPQKTSESLYMYQSERMYSESTLI